MQATSNPPDPSASVTNTASPVPIANGKVTPLAICIRDLRVNYGKFEAVKGISIDIPQGEVFGFIGPNGAGKSSTFRVLATLQPKFRGLALVCGLDVLSQAQKDSLDIEEFIFHIIEPEADDDEKVVYLDSVTLQEKQRTFFLDRLRDTAEGTQYVFQQDAVTLKEKCAQLVAPRADFNLLSRQITADFAGRHKGQMSAGVFVVAIVRYQATARSQKKLVLLIKMDNSPSFSYSHKQVNGKRVAEMREVPNALNETKKAIQKSAVIDVGGEFACDVWAAAGIVDTGLSFLSFLELYRTDVAERRVTTRRVVEAFDVVEQSLS